MVIKTIGKGKIKLQVNLITTIKDLSWCEIMYKSDDHDGVRGSWL